MSTTDINTIEQHIKKIELEKVNAISDESIKEIFSLLSNIDKDLSILLNIMKDLILELEDQNLKTLYVIKVVKFYGINNSDILSSRNKHFIKNGMLIRKKFLKQKEKEMLEILLNQINLKVF